MVMVSSSGRVALSIRASGIGINAVIRVISSTQTAPFSKESGQMTSATALESSPGEIGRSTRETLLTIKSVARVYLSGCLVPVTRGSGKRTKKKVTAS